MNNAFLLLGSNTGNRKDMLQRASELLQHYGSALKTSSVYETQAWGIEDQAAFLNQVICLETSLSPIDLLQGILHIESLLGRFRGQKWGPRTIDIDILLYDHDIIDLPDLKIPHPFLPERRFTLIPLSEIAPDYIHPVLRKTIRQLLDECTDKLDVKKYRSN
jgi:2-amino-4-hydroxy-6-hydroxymethyldihydropteridine diphosphokinase